MESSLKHSHILLRKTCPCFSLNISFSSHDHCQHQWTATSYFTLEPQQLKCVPTSRPFSRGTVSLANSGQITLQKSCLPYIHPYAKSTVAYSGLNAVSRVPPPQNVMVLWGGGFGRHSGLDEDRRVKPLWMGLVALKSHERAGFLSLLLAMRMLAICNQESSHLNLTWLTSWSGNFQFPELWEINLCYQPTSIWCYVREAWTKAVLHYL